MAINFNRQLHNTYNISGSNFQKGIKAGDFFINELNPGVSIGNVHQYSITNPLQAVEINSISGLNSQTVQMPLNFVTPEIGKILVINQNEKGILFDYPRVLSFTCDQPCTVTFNMIDQYGNKVVNKIVGTEDASNYIGKTNLGPSILSSVSVEGTGTGNWTCTVSTTNTFELPYTDMGNKLFLEQVTMFKNGLNTDFNVVPLTATSAFSNTDNLYEISCNYTPATWTTPITLSTGNPRPLIEFLYLGEQLTFPTTNNYSFMVTQNVFPTFHPSLSGYMTQQQADEGITTFGLPTLSTNYQGWMG